MKNLLVFLAVSVLAIGVVYAGDKEEATKDHLGGLPTINYAGPQATETEPNDACTEADGPLTVGSFFDGEITAGDEDWYAIVVEDGECLVFETNETPGQGSMDTKLYVVGADCDINNWLAFNDDGGAGLYSRIEHTFSPAGTYYVVVTGFGATTTGFYTLTTEADCPPPPPEPGSTCNFTFVCTDWDFTVSDHGFTPTPCDGGSPVWEYGAETTVPGSPGNVWATTLNANYINSAGEGLLSPPFLVDATCQWMEIRAYVETERYPASLNAYDGGNVTVNDVVIPPFEGYDGPINSGPPACVADEDAFTGWTDRPVRTWGRSCFDLSQFVGQTIQVRFDFGSDSSVNRPGWYLQYVRIGSTETPVPTEEKTWGNIKTLYR